MTDASVLDRRLALLRARRDPARPAADVRADGNGGYRPVHHAGGVDREAARRLAASLEGRCILATNGAVVETEASFRLHPDLGGLARLPYDIDPSCPLVLLDTETTGLGTAVGTLPFLVGIGLWEGDRFRVRQLFLPDHSDEDAFLDVLAALVPPDAWLVTYNGRSFDWPLIVTRYRLRRRRPPAHRGHLDLLPVARQLWRHRLGDARLSTVEARIAGVRRRDDLPGALIPARYFAYLRGGPPTLLHAVARHNLQDVLSLATLLRVLARMASIEADPSSVHPGDLLGIARAYGRRRRHEDALACLDRAVASAGSATVWRHERQRLLQRAMLERAHTLTRLGRRGDALEAWLALAEGGGVFAGIAWSQIAKHREHVQRDSRGALDAAERAATIAHRSRALGRPLHGLERDLARRLARLRSPRLSRSPRAA